MKKKLPILLMLLTVGFGFAGYILAGTSLYEALLLSLKFLTFGADFEPTNPLIEIARWLGITFAFSFVYTIVETALTVSTETIAMRLKCRRPGAIAVHGDGILADRLVSNLPRKAIRSDRASAFRAERQVLLFSSDEKAMKFYNEHLDDLEKAQEVFLSLDRITPVVAREKGVFVFSMASACAQLYWEQHPVAREESIVIIGEGAYAEALLTEGLLVNLFSVEGGVSYVVYGDWARYRALHTGLEEAMGVNADELRFADYDWSQDLAVMRSADRIVLCCAPEENLGIASDLRSAGIETVIHMRSDSEDCVGFLGMPATSVFGTTDQLCTEAIVLQRTYQEGGKLSAITYRLGTSGCDGCKRQPLLPNDAIGDAAEDEGRFAIRESRLKAVDYERCLTCPRFNAEWDQMDEFTKASNYAVAAHDGQKRRLLAAAASEHGLRDAGPDDCFEKLPLDARDYLQEIEHIRWCRFHYLNNWTYGPNGKNGSARTHHYLVPYADLPRAVKDMDGDPYCTLRYRDKGHTAR